MSKDHPQPGSDIKTQLVLQLERKKSKKIIIQAINQGKLMIQILMQIKLISQKKRIQVLLHKNSFLQKETEPKGAYIPLQSRLEQNRTLPLLFRKLTQKIQRNLPMLKPFVINCCVRTEKCKRGLLIRWWHLMQL